MVGVGDGELVQLGLVLRQVVQEQVVEEVVLGLICHSSSTCYGGKSSGYV